LHRLPTVKDAPMIAPPQPPSETVVAIDPSAAGYPGAVGDRSVGAAAWARVRRLNRRWTILITGAILLLSGAAAISAADVDTNTGKDLLGLVKEVGVDVVRLRWQFAAVVLTLAALHYLATAIAARASAGTELALGETLLVQLGAAAANRLTPAGIGGSALNVRYFSRRGMQPSAALAAVAALAVLGAIADFLVLLVLVFLGHRLGLDGASHELGAVTSKVTHAFVSVRSPWPWIGAAVVLGLLLISRLLRRRSGREQPSNQFWPQLVGLLRRPRALLTLLLASGSTTLLLGFAFVASTEMVPGPRPTMPLGALLVAFMLGAAAGTSVPIPAGLGTTEAALIGVLVSAHVDVGHAVQVVLVFRLLTFWLPAVIGVLALRRLRRVGAI
jgi:uncharacterized membrane protein YbhN (UPF0104 family)